MENNKLRPRISQWHNILILVISSLFFGLIGRYLDKYLGAKQIDGVIGDFLAGHQIDSRHGELFGSAFGLVVGVVLNELRGFLNEGRAAAERYHATEQIKK